MVNSLLRHIVELFKNYNSPLIIIENNDGFLLREDIIKVLESNNFLVSTGDKLAQRISFELRDTGKTLLLINKDQRSYLEDMEQVAVKIEFFISQHIQGYHIPTIIHQPLKVLEVLFKKKQVISLSKQETEKELEEIDLEDNINQEPFDRKVFLDNIGKLQGYDDKDWLSIMDIFSRAINETVGSSDLDFVLNELKKVNSIFQEFLKKKYAPLKNSNSTKKPRIVSKILDHIDFNYKNQKVALIVVDGMSFWQYKNISNNIPGNKVEDITYSWIPSITQLSRQAIFKGGNPLVSYKQNPNNESKLWKNYWRLKNFNDFEIDYQYNKLEPKLSDNIKRLAVVFKDLDEYMHSSNDYNDLMKLTENWFVRSGFRNVIEQLLEQEFKIFITSDHGNVQARGWRGLTGKEKLGTNKSGSRSQRHIEYSENWLKDEFLTNNPELFNSIVQDERSLYFKDELSFSKEEQLVTHGGAHISEVLIPFIKISNEK